MSETQRAAGALSERGGAGETPAFNDPAEQFGLLMGSVEDFALMFQDAEGRVTSWGVGAARLFGYTAEDMVGGTAHVLWTPEDREGRIPEREMAQARECGKAADVRWHVRRDGTRFWCEGTMTALRDGDGSLRGFAKVLRDATEQKRHDDRMRFLTTRARALLWHGTVYDTGLGAGRFAWDTQVFDEEAAQEFCPLTVGEGEGYLEAWYRHRLPEGRALTDRLSFDALRENHPGYSAEFGCATASGAVRWFSEQVHVEPDGPGRWRVVGVALDTTERKAVEDALQTAYERDHHIAETLQHALILSPSMNALRGLRAEPFYESALDEALVGGDFFDAFPMDGGRVALVVGDASGKGVEAAARTAEVKYAVRAFLSEYPYPARTLQRVNEFLCQNYQLQGAGGGHVPFTFVALTLAVIDPTSGEALVSVAGMEPPLLLRGDCAAEAVTARGLPLGVDASAVYEVAAARLAPGDTLLMATDGLTEARRGRELLGHDGLMRLAAEVCNGRADLRETGRILVERVRDFASGRFQDDMCLLLARLK